MKHILTLITTVIVLLGSCSKSDENVESQFPPVKEFSNKIELDSLVVKGDSILLSWSVLKHDAFRSYSVVSREYPGGPLHQLAVINDAKSPRTILTEVPYSPEVSYQVLGHRNEAKAITSNIVYYKRPEIPLLHMNLNDVMYREEDQLLYLFEKEGRISIFDLKSNKITKQIDASSGFADFDVYQGKSELYVLDKKGLLMVYDAHTLEKITQITVGGYTRSVVSNKNMLYVFTSDDGRPPIKVYRRSDLKLIDELGENDGDRIFKIPGKGTGLLQVGRKQHYYQFNDQGILQNQSSEKFDSFYTANPLIMAISPNGSKYITGSTGKIFNMDFSFDQSLTPESNEFESFCFDHDGTYLYGVLDSKKSIKVFSTNDYTYLKTIQTKADPFRIFSTKDGILNIGTLYVNFISGYNEIGKVVIQKLGK